MGSYGLLDPFPIFRMNRLKPGARLLIETVACPTPDLLVTGADIEHLVFLGIDHPEDFGDILGQLPEALLTLPPLLLGALALGNIVEARIDLIRLLLSGVELRD